MRKALILIFILLLTLPSSAQDVDIPSSSSTDTFLSLNSWIIPFFEPGATGDEARAKTYSQIKADVLAGVTTGTGTFTGLTDTPSNLGNAGQLVAVNNARTQLEYINAPTGFSGNYNDLSNTPTIPAAQVNSDWTANSGISEIINKPTIPAAQVNSDWTASSGVAEILNKPTIPAAVSRANVYAQVRDIIVQGLNITATDSDSAQTVTIAGQAAGVTDISGKLDTNLGNVVSLSSSAQSAFRSAIGAGDSSVAAMPDLADIPDTYGNAGERLAVNAGASGFVYVAAPVTFSGVYGDLSGLPTLFSGSYTDLRNQPTIPDAVSRANVYAQVMDIIVQGANITATDSDSAMTVTIAGQAAGAPATSLLGLSDFPSSFSSAAGQTVVVNSGESALVYAPFPADGATGATGATGPVGPAGADSTVPGPAGADGATGPAGAMGQAADVTGRFFYRL